LKAAIFELDFVYQTNRLLDVPRLVAGRRKLFRECINVDWIKLDGHGNRNVPVEVVPLAYWNKRVNVLDAHGEERWFRFNREIVIEERQRL